jgi:hypothetical protein
MFYLGTLGHEMSSMDFIGQPVPDGKGGDHVETEECQVGDVFTIERLIPQMGMDETQSPEGLSSKGEAFELRYEDTMRISYDHMGDRTTSVGDDTELFSRFKRDPREIPGKFLRKDLIGRNPAAIDLLKEMKKAFFEACGMSVKRCYFDNLIMVDFNRWGCS